MEEKITTKTFTLIEVTKVAIEQHHNNKNKKVYSNESCVKLEYTFCLCLWLFKNIIKFEEKQLIFPQKITRLFD
jgi:hypothetical protein